MKTCVLMTMVVLNNILNPGRKLLTKQNRSKRKGMALVKFGGGVVGMSGSIGGTTFARNRSGSYARSRTKPVNPNTAAQQHVRSIVSTIRDAWSNTLTTAQRLAWTTYANNVSMLNRLGESINLTGWNMFMRTSMNRLYNGESIVAAGPTTFTLAEQDESVVVTSSETANAISVAYDDTMDWCDEDGSFLSVYESAPQNETVNFFDGPWIRLGSVDGDSTTPPSSPAAFTSKFTLTEGQKQFYQFRICRADGRLSEPFRAEDIIGA